MSDSLNDGAGASGGGPLPAVQARPDVIALTGGKGGVGKTSVAVNLALTLARSGQRVLLLDADTDLANVSILLGLYPTRTLEHAMDGACPLAEVIQEAPYGLHVIAGASGVQRCMDLDLEDAHHILDELAGIEQAYDTILIDTASGLRPAALHMIAASALACVVITPDPASLTDAFSLLRVLQRRGYRRTPGVIVNMAAGASQAQSVYRRFSGAVRRHLGMDAEYIGAIWRDDSIRQSVELQRPVATLSGMDPSSRQFVTLADQLRGHLSRQPPRKGGLAAYWRHRSRRQQANFDRVASDAAATSLSSTAAPSAAKAVSGSSRQNATDDSAMPVFQASPASDRMNDSAQAKCQALFGDLDRLLAEAPGDAMLRQEALRGAAALLSRMASVEEGAGSGSDAGYCRGEFGSQEVLLARLKSQPDTVRVEGFLASVSNSCDQ